MPWTDADTGAPVDPNDVKTAILGSNIKVKTPAEVGSGAVNAAAAAAAAGDTALTHPLDTGSKIKMLIQKNAGPLAAQMGGEMAGAGIGTGIAGMLAPDTAGLSMLPLLLSAGGAGVANIGAMKGLPKEYGGDPEATKFNDFMWGAVPAGVGRAVPAGVGRFLAKKLAKGALETGTEFEKTAQDVAKSTREQIATGLQGPEVTAANIRQVGQALGSPTGYAAPAPEGDARTAAAIQAQAHVLGPIDRQRTKLGEPIGEAYKALKGMPPIDPAKAQAIADAARNVQSSLLSPAPKAQAALNKLKSLAPENAVQIRPGMDAQQQSNASIIAMMKGDVGGNSVTPDELRNLRQGLGKSLSSAQGGDAHAIKDLRQAIDEQLMPMLPPDIKAKHAAYHNFMQNYPWRSINQMRQIGDPEGIGNWMFNPKRAASVVNESVRNATPAERQGYQQMFAQHVLQDVDPDTDAAQQAKVLRAKLEPFKRKGTLNALYGAQSEPMFRNFIHLPERRAALAKSLRSPEGQKLYLDGFMQEAKRSGKAGHEAAAAGFGQWYDTLSPEQQKIVRQSAPQASLPAQTPQLPSPQQALADQLRPAAGGKFAVPKFVLASSLGGAAMGAMSGYTARYAIGFGLISAAGSGTKAIMRHGGADIVARMYQSPTGRAAGAAAFRALAQMGGRALHNAAQQSGDDDAAD